MISGCLMVKTSANIQQKYDWLKTFSYVLGMKTGFTHLAFCHHRQADALHYVIPKMCAGLAGIEKQGGHGRNTKGIKTTVEDANGYKTQNKQRHSALQRTANGTLEGGLWQCERRSLARRKTVFHNVMSRRRLHILAANGV